MNTVPIDCVPADAIVHLCRIGGHVILDSGDEVELVHWFTLGRNRARCAVRWPSGRTRTIRKSSVVAAVVTAETDVAVPAAGGAWAS